MASLGYFHRDFLTAKTQYEAKVVPLPPPPAPLASLVRRPLIQSKGMGPVLCPHSPSCMGFVPICPQYRPQ